MISQDLKHALATAEKRHKERHPISSRLHAEAARVMPGGNTRSVLHYSPFPLHWARGEGNRLIDVDGLEYLDLLGEYSAGLYGHSNNTIRAALRRAIDDGLVLGGPNVYEARLAQAIIARFASIELIRFTNSGTEANLMAIAAARACSPDRPRVMVFKGAYHGGVLNFRGGRDSAGGGGSGINVPFDWVMGEFNDTVGTRALLRDCAGSIAAVIVEPMLGGECIPGDAEFLRMLRTECTASAAILIFDEVMTSRLSPAGLQGLLGIEPDLTTFGKYLGGGASFGAFGGRRHIMERFDPARADALEHAGTFNNNVLSMAAGLAGLTQVFTAAEAHRINALGDRLRERLNESGRRRGVPFRASGVGSLIGMHFDGPAALCTLFHLDMLERQFYFSKRGYIALSLPTVEEECAQFAAAVEEVLTTRAALILESAA